MNTNNNYQKLLEEDDEETLIINEDLFDQKDLEISDDEQIIIQNDEKENEYSFNSGKSNNKSNSQNQEKGINKNINNDNQNLINNNNINDKLSDELNIKKENEENNKNKKKENINVKNKNNNKKNKENIEIGKNKKQNIKYVKKIINSKNIKINKKVIPNNSQMLKNRMQDKIGVKNSNYKNNDNNKNYNNSVVIQKCKQNDFLTNDSDINNEHKKISYDNLVQNIYYKVKKADRKSKSKEKSDYSEKIVNRSKNKIKDIKNIKKNNHNSSVKKNQNKEKSNKEKEKNNNKNNKTKIKSKSNSRMRSTSKRYEKDNNTQDKNKYESKNKHYNHNKSHSHYVYILNTAKNKKTKNIYFDNNRKSKSNSINKEKISLDSKNSIQNSAMSQIKKNYIFEAENLKKILINKMNNQIEEVIKGKQKFFFNENNKLFFLGFCDLLFELGFLHIKETKISDISKIEENIKNLYTQPFTNRDILTENFLYNEQKLLICAWKTILNNFHLVNEFDSLPEENDEITLDDCKLFIFIITGLFIGYNGNKFIKDDKEEHNYNIDIDKKNLFNNDSSNNLNNNNLILNTNNSNILKNINNFEQCNRFSKYKKIRNYSPSPKRGNVYFIKKNGSKYEYNYINNKENILKSILEKRIKSDYNYKNILKIKNYFKYFSELRKLYNLYKKDLRNINKKIKIEKEFTFSPKTNKNKNQLFKNFSPSMNFYERNAFIKNINEQKIKKLEDERNKELLKECTFEPSQKIKKLNINPIEISNRLYYNNSNKKINNTDIMNKSFISPNKSPTVENSGKKLFYKPKIAKLNMNNNINNTNNKPNHTYNISSNIISNKYKNNINTSYSKSNKNNHNILKEECFFSPEVNKKFNRGMFTHSPLVNDKLLKKRINTLRNTNFKKFVYNYKKNKKILKEIVNEEKKYMKLDIEKKTNKDTFDKFKDNKLYNNYISNEPLFIVEIKIKEEIKRIEVYQDDNLEKITYDFCIENSLGESSFEKILMIIKEKKEEISNGIYNEKINYSEINKEEDNNENNIINKKNGDENIKKIEENKNDEIENKKFINKENEDIIVENNTNIKNDNKDNITRGNNLINNDIENNYYK